MDTYSAYLLYVELMQHVCTPACGGASAWETAANRESRCADYREKDNSNYPPRPQPPATDD